MPALVILIISLVLIGLLFLFKGLEIYYGQKAITKSFLRRSDLWLIRSWSRIKYYFSRINHQNCRLCLCSFITWAKRFIIVIKRRFDHKQSHFFTKREVNNLKTRGPVSFFLKDVSDYKNTLREEKKSEE